MIVLDYRNSRPIYEQIRDRLRQMIVTGALEEDEKLPSVRSLASDLAVNPNTIQRAYRELEQEGYLYSVTGKGNFVSRSPDADRMRIEKLKGELLKIIEELRNLDVSNREIADWISAEDEND